MMNIREAAIAKLQQLSEPSLKTVNEFIDVLIAQQYNQEVKPQSSETITKNWQEWFAEVDELEVSPHQPQAQEDYQQHLLNKYRQQGLEL